MEGKKDIKVFIRLVLKPQNYIINKKKKLFFLECADRRD